MDECKECGHEGEGELCELCAYDRRMSEQYALLRTVEAELGLEEGEAEWPI